MVATADSRGGGKYYFAVVGWAEDWFDGMANDDDVVPVFQARGWESRGWESRGWKPLAIDLRPVGA
jgi:hypothetical protein